MLTSLKNLTKSNPVLRCGVYRPPRLMMAYTVRPPATLEERVFQEVPRDGRPDGVMMEVGATCSSRRTGRSCTMRAA